MLYRRLYRSRIEYVVYVVQELIMFFLCWYRISCNPGFSVTSYITKTNFKLPLFLLLPPECWITGIQYCSGWKHLALFKIKECLCSPADVC